MVNVRRSRVSADALLLDYLIGPIGLKRGAAKNLLKHGAIAVNGAVVRQFNHPLAIGDEIAISAARTATAAERLRDARIRIVYEDDALVVIEKPVGLLTVATDTEKTDTLFVRLNDFLRGRDGNSARALVVHRLDRDTSGLVVFAKTAEAKERLQAAWPSVEKIYAAIVVGQPDPARGTMESYLSETQTLAVASSRHPSAEGRLAVSQYRTLQSRGDFSLVEIRLLTGRKHQIRVHMASLNCPIAGDRRYGTKIDPCGRLALHAQQLSLRHPATGRQLVVSSPMPPAMQRLFPARRPPPHSEASSKRQRGRTAG